MTLTFDADALLKFADDCERVSEAVPQVLSDVANDIGDAIEGRAVVNATKHYKSGKMHNSIRNLPKSVTANAAVVEVSVSAVSGKGFPYPIVVDKGRPAIVRPKGVGPLVFPVKDGKPVFTRKVKAYAGSGFFTNAVNETEPEMQIVADLGAQRLLDMLRR